MTAPVQLVVAAFPNEDEAQRVYKNLKQSQKDGLIRIENAAVLTKNADGKLHVKDVHDMRTGKGAAIGGVLGAGLGLLAGPVGWLALGGAVAGGLIARRSDGGFDDERLKKLGEGLTPGSSAIVAVVEHTWVAEVQAAVAEAGVDAITAEISADIAAQLEAGGEVVYTAVASDEGLVTGRVTTTGDRVEMSATELSDADINHVSAVGVVEADETEETAEADEAADTSGEAGA